MVKWYFAGVTRPLSGERTFPSTHCVGKIEYPHAKNEGEHIIQHIQTLTQNELKT